MGENLTVDIILTLIMTILISFSFMGFMYKFNKKEYFMSGSYLSGMISFVTILVKFILRH